MVLIRLTLMFIQSHGCPQICMPNSVERLLEIHEDIVKVLWVLQVFLTKYSKIKKLLSCAPSCPEPAFDDTAH